MSPSSKAATCRRTPNWLGVLLLCFILLPSSFYLSAFTQPCSVDWFKVAGGGTSTGDVFTVTGTFGQHDAGGPMAGGGYSVASGYWGQLDLTLFNTNGTAPVINFQSPLSVYPSSVGFYFSISGTSPIYFQWQKYTGNWVNLSDGVGVYGANTTGLSLDLGVAGYPGSYQLIAISPYGSVTSSIVSVPSYYAPSILTQPRSVTNVIGSYVGFLVVANGNPSPNYQWRLNGAIITNEIGSSYYFIATNSGSYDVVVSSILGTAVSSAATLLTTNGTGPAIQTQPQSITNVIGGLTTFAVAAPGNPALNFQWRLNGSNIFGAYSRSYSFIATKAGSYDVVLANYYGSITSSVATLTVTNGFGPSILAQPQSRTKVVGTLASFSVTATGNPVPTYQWRFNGVPVYGGFASTYSFAAFASGNYDVVVANYYRSITSSVAILTVLPPATSAGGFVTFQAANVVAGQTNFTSQSTIASQIVTPGPTSVAISSQGKMAVGEQSCDRVLLWNSIPVSNGTPADVVLGKADFTTTLPGTTASLCDSVEGVTFSPDGSKLIVCDARNNRVLI